MGPVFYGAAGRLYCLPVGATLAHVFSCGSFGQKEGPGAFFLLRETTGQRLKPPGQAGAQEAQVLRK